MAEIEKSLNKKDSIEALCRQNSNSLKHTNDVVESLTGKTLTWLLEALANRGEEVRNAPDKDDVQNDR